MSPINLYFFIFASTILITRLFLYLKPISSPTLKGWRVHHYMYGLLLILISIGAKNKNIFAIGLGLFIDEVPYLILRGKTHKTIIL